MTTTDQGEAEEEAPVRQQVAVETQSYTHAHTHRANRDACERGRAGSWGGSCSRVTMETVSE